MSKKLAIKGHPTRGKEIIELLEMMGGKNIYNFSGFDDYAYYVIAGCQNKIKAGEYIFGDEDMHLFTLEEFLVKYPFKVGDKVVDCYGNPVTIKSMKWSEDFETMVYDFVETEDVLCAEDIETVNDIHTKPSKMKIVLAELLEYIKTTPKEELEREFEEIKEWLNVGPTVEEFRTFCECVNKKPVYPKTYLECREILGEKDMYQSVSGYKGELLTNFQRLLIFRDAYWKIAGEEMGLGKPWKPDWNNERTFYCIFNSENKIVKRFLCTENKILLFPTEEMRDAFYENFKDLINNCKELL